MKTLTVRLKEAENRAENAEKSVKRLQKEVDRLEGTLRESGCEDLKPLAVQRLPYRVVVSVAWEVLANSCTTYNHYTDNNTGCCSAHFIHILPPSIK